MTFIKLGKEDVDLIVKINSQGFSDGWSAQMLSDSFVKGGLKAVALKVEENFVGVITYTQVLDSADIEGVCVIKGERKKGYGKALLRFVEGELKREGVKQILLEVRESNESARALYNACGFSNLSVRKNYYDNGENAVIMIKEL